jgi:hypothetical protein
MKIVRSFLTVVFCLWFTLAGFSQETLPPYHWANRYVEYLKVSGYLPELSMIERPFTRQQIARHLLKINWQAVARNSRERGIIRLLYREFALEMEQLGNLPEEEWKVLIQRALDILQLNIFPESSNPSLKLGAFGEGAYNYAEESEVDEFDIDLHLQAGVFWKDHLTLYHNTRIFNNADSNYIGKEYGKMFAYTEQGYISLNFNWIRAKFGRDFKQTGPGRSGQLLISDNSQPFDVYEVRLGNKFVQFSFWGFFLDRRTFVDSTQQNYRNVANRYLNGHRLSFNIKDRVFLGFSEVVLYGGANRVWEFGYMNPFAVYYAHNVNQEPGIPDGNIFYNFDWDLYLFPDWEIYGELLIDDIQVDKKSPGDLEPNEWGLIAGVNWSNPAGLGGGLVNAEYVQVRNRTYNVASNDWNKYLHRNEVIGYNRGNNFWRLGGSFRYWAQPELSLRLFGNLVKKGEGNVQGEFNDDFLDYTVEKGYNEPFPFGVVERHWQYGISAFYKPHQLGHIRVDLAFNDINNYRNVSGNTFSEFSARVNLWLQWSKLWIW